MRIIECDEILNKKDFASLNNSDFEKQVINFCISKLNEYENEVLEKNQIEEPVKKYEIFELRTSNGLKKFVLDNSLIDFNGDKEKEEVYYSANLAKNICYNMKRLSEDAALSDKDAKFEFEEEINKINEKIQDLKELDANEFNNDKFIYLTLREANIIDTVNENLKSNTSLEEENAKLKKKVKENEEQIRDLMNKLQISLKDIENYRDKLKIREKTKFEKFIDKLKGLKND